MRKSSRHGDVTRSDGAGEMTSATTPAIAGREQRPVLTGFESALARNEVFAESGAHRDAVVFPNLQLFVVACLDPRVDPAHILGLGLSDAIVIRNVGGRVTPEVINDIAFIGQIAETMTPDGFGVEVAVIHHTQCGAGALHDESFRSRYAQRIGVDESSLVQRAIRDPEETVATDVQRLRHASSISSRFTLSGRVYDVTTGLVKTIIPPAPARRPSR